MSLNVDEGGKPQKILTHEYMPDGIEVCDDRIYWTDMGNPSVNEGQVFSAKLDGSDIKTVVPSGKVFTPKQLIIDQKAKQAYFCDREGCRVMRVNLDGSELQTLVSRSANWQKGDTDQTKWCVGIAVSQKLGKVGFTYDCAMTEKLTSCELDLLDAEGTIQGLPRPHFLRRSGHSERSS